MTIVGIFDRKAQSFISLGTTPHVGVAARELAETVNNKEHPTNISKWPGDFSLWDLGTFNTETGKVEAKLNEQRDYNRTLITECEALKQT